MTEDKNDEILLATLQIEYQEVFDSAIRSRVIKHPMFASVETDTDESVTASARRLSSDKYGALQGKIKRLSNQGTASISNLTASKDLVVKVKCSIYRSGVAGSKRR